MSKRANPARSDDILRLIYVAQISWFLWLFAAIIALLFEDMDGAFGPLFFCGTILAILSGYRMNDSAVIRVAYRLFYKTVFCVVFTAGTIFVCTLLVLTLQTFVSNGTIPDIIANQSISGEKLKPVEGLYTTVKLGALFTGMTTIMVTGDWARRQSTIPRIAFFGKRLTAFIYWIGGFSTGIGFLMLLIFFLDTSSNFQFVLNTPPKLLYTISVPVFFLCPLLVFVITPMRVIFVFRVTWRRVFG